MNTHVNVDVHGNGNVKQTSVHIYIYIYIGTHTCIRTEALTCVTIFLEHLATITASSACHGLTAWVLFFVTNVGSRRMGVGYGPPVVSRPGMEVLYGYQ